MAKTNKHEEFEAIRQHTAPPDRLPSKIGFGGEEFRAIYRGKESLAKTCRAKVKRRTRSPRGVGRALRRPGNSNVNLEVSRLLFDLIERQRALQLPRLLGDPLARIMHESPAATADLAVLPGVLGPRTLRRTDKYGSGPVPRYRGMVARWHDHRHDLATASRA